MAKQNGYFQLSVKSDGTYLHIIPARDDGEALRVGEVTDYLSLKGLSFDLKTVNDAVVCGDDTTIRLSTDQPLKEREMMVLKYDENHMVCTARFYPPFEGAELMTGQEILADLKYNKVTFGVDQKAVSDFLATRHYCTDYVLARGQEMKESTDARIEYLFRTDLSGRPAMNEDGSVDFFHLDNICHCKKGDVLARMIPVDPGVPGTNVHGETVKPKIPRRVLFSHGKNIVKSEDGLSIIADVNGHVTLVEDKVFVSATLELPNVDVSTGNVEYDGNVLVQGNVISGFTVKASGDVEVQGIVEGAVIEAGGQIIIRRGINGMARGVLNAGSNVLSKFIENATVSSGGYIETDCIIHSKVTAADRIVVQGKKGFITGGVVFAGHYLEVKTLGSDMGVDTVVEVGTDPQMKARYASLQKEIASLRKEIARIEPVVKAIGERLGRGEKMDMAQLKQTKLLSKALSDNKEKMKQDMTEAAKLEIQFDVRSDAYVRITGEAFPGTRITISESNLVLKTPYHYCRFVREGADVVMKPN